MAEDQRKGATPRKKPKPPCTLDNLVEAIRAQTDAISALAESNMMLVAAMAQADEDEQASSGQTLG